MSLFQSSLGSLGLIGWLAIPGMAQEGADTGVPTVSRGNWIELFSNPMTLLLLAAMAFYLLLLVPNYRASRRAQKELEEKLANLKKNDRVVTTFGVHGLVAGINLESKTVTLRIDENTNAKMTVNRETIRVVNKD